MNSKLVIFFLVCFLGLCQASGLNLKAAGKCMKETGVPQSTIMDLQKALVARKVIGLDDKTKCYLKCYVTEDGWMTKDGKVTEEVLKHMPEDLKPKYDKCKEVNDENLCERVYQFFVCVFE